MLSSTPRGSGIDSDSHSSSASTHWPHLAGCILVQWFWRLRWCFESLARIAAAIGARIANPSSRAGQSHDILWTVVENRQAPRAGPRDLPRLPPFVLLALRLRLTARCLHPRATVCGCVAKQLKRHDLHPLYILMSLSPSQTASYYQTSAPENSRIHRPALPPPPLFVPIALQIVAGCDSLCFRRI